MLHERRFHTGTVELNYAEGPAVGSPFVVLHGGAGGWQSGLGLAELLAERWHVYAPDFRGHGLSGHVPGRYTLRDYAADTAAFLAGVVPEPAVVYGHSLGGEVAIMVAAHHPALVRALLVGDAPMLKENHVTQAPGHRAMNVLWHSLAGRPVDEIAAGLRQMPVAVPGAEAPVPAREAFGEESPWFAFQATNLNRLDPGTLAAVLAGPEVMLEGYDADTLLPAIGCPVLILQADPAAGGFLRDEEVELALQLLPRADHVRLPGIGHELHGPPGQERTVLEAITPLLNRL